MGDHLGVKGTAPVERLGKGKDIGISDEPGATTISSFLSPSFTTR